MAGEEEATDLRLCILVHIQMYIYCNGPRQPSFRKSVGSPAVLFHKPTVILLTAKSSRSHNCGQRLPSLATRANNLRLLLANGHICEILPWGVK